MRRALLGLLVLVLVAGCSTGKDAVSQGSSFEFVAPGGKTDITYDVSDRKPIPNLSGDDLMNEGKQLSLAQFKGKVVVLNVWGQWCAPCRTESPEMERLYQSEQAKGVQVLGFDVRDYDRSAPQDFVRDRGLTYPSIYDPPGRGLLQLKGYPVNVVPSTIVLDKQQRVAAVYLRSLLAGDIQPLVQKLAAE
ncbi:TlpA family protein disulfide reductase [Amycolatopsis acidiphila]|uniref:TlpA family protein disulfide reductase n=1 Tax=Amycolatopsis acidiphila TaxID=715473 RepID=A0A558A011_9PSEU|nr:TlpA disulfide reductase family protein [Amycolatopsis acidiphila]TVT17577.1 TlpA family protein disulfide reductase [Amycolatopsis acidiphila]UIJ60517.1 TlpA family protein disulfide reductase [Amycolatopsis acidiphila]GHG82394.1 cytochrome c biogenesis protein [Amycolatopsis acidiphila]